MKLLTSFDDCATLQKGHTLRKIFTGGSNDYQVYANNRTSSVDLLKLPLSTPRIVSDGETTIINNTEISGGFPIYKEYQELLDGTWYLL